MSETRQVWKPWRANTRTAASRMIRRLSTVGFVAATSGSSRGPWPSRPIRGGQGPREGALGGDLSGPAVGRRAAVGQRRHRAPDLRLTVEVELGEREGLRVRR